MTSHHPGPAPGGHIGHDTQYPPAPRERRRFNVPVVLAVVLGVALIVAAVWFFVGRDSTSVDSGDSELPSFSGEPSLVPVPNEGARFSVPLGDVIVQGDGSNVWAIDDDGETQWYHENMDAHELCADSVGATRIDGPYVAITCDSATSDTLTFARLVDERGDLHRSFSGARPLTANITPNGDVLTCVMPYLRMSEGMSDNVAWMVEVDRCEASVEIVDDYVVYWMEGQKKRIPLDLETGEIPQAISTATERRGGEEWRATPAGDNFAITWYAGPTPTEFALVDSSGQDLFDPIMGGQFVARAGENVIINDHQNGEVAMLDAAGNDVWRQPGNDAIGCVGGVDESYIWGRVGGCVANDGMLTAVADVSTGELLYTKEGFIETIDQSAHGFILKGENELIGLEGIEESWSIPIERSIRKIEDGNYFLSQKGSRELIKVTDE